MRMSEFVTMRDEVSCYGGEIDKKEKKVGIKKGIT